MKDGISRHLYMLHFSLLVLCRQADEVLLSTFAGKFAVVNATFLTDPSMEWSPLQCRVEDCNCSCAAKFTYHNEAKDHYVLYRLEVDSKASISSVMTANARTSQLIMTTGAQLFRKATVFASALGNLPVVSIHPYHHWHKDGQYLSNGFIPRYGQEMKGRALAQLLLQPETQLILKRVLIVSEDVASLELREFYVEMERYRAAAGMTVHFSVKHAVINSKSFLFKYVLDRRYYGFDVVIVDCRLEFFLEFSSVLLAEQALSRHAWIILLHDLVEVQRSSVLPAIAGKLQQLDVQLFVFCQTVPGEDGLCRNFSSPASVYYRLFNDSLTAISEAIITSGFDSTSVFFYDTLATNLVKQCVNTPYGNLVLMTSGNVSANCLNASNVQFQLLSQKNMSQWMVAAKWSAMGPLDVIAGITKFDHMIDGEFSDLLTFSGKLRILYGPGYFPFTHSNTTHNYSGIDFDLVYRIADGLGIGQGNVEFIPLDSKYSWSDMVALVGQENSDYDMAIGGITATANRALTSNFSRSYFFTGLSVLVSRPVSSEINYMWRFFEPFNWTVWLLIIAMVVLSSFMSKWFGMTPRYSEGLWLSCIVIFFMNENRLVTVRNIFGRIYVLALSLVVLILVSAYTANMATFLTSQKQPVAVESLSSLKRQPVAVGVGGISYNLLSEQTALLNLITVRSREAGQMIRNGDAVAYVGDTPEVIGLASKQPLCDLYVLDKEYFPNPFAFAVSDRLFASHGRLIDDIIAHAVIEQFVSASYALHSQYGAICDDVKGIRNANDEASGRLDIDNLGGVFVIALTAAAVFLIAKAVLALRHLTFKSSRIGVEGSKS
jgi:ABC-type amino acid transport substrate-binding protein